ncbi:MupA/Atu3671 family FMN-dependent luciferase-like monooxygenase [Streptomyces sp. NPDC001941]|uniref:MupA/Atu3671 family FMN-dependent luciferase-like monooxygenase n=1 Tax=Streptomyces sp. NPDC001941 TaxID=3154659 RepID=UPI00331F0E91
MTSLDEKLAEMAALSRRIAEQMEQVAPQTAAQVPPQSAARVAPQVPPQAAPAPADAPAAAPVVHGPRVTVPRASGMVGAGAEAGRRAHLDDLVGRFNARTPTSKDLAQRHRRVLADSRAVVGFRSATKEMLYPLVGRSARGARLVDVDGNEYVDITMGFGVLLFGHDPDFVTEAVREHLSRGIQLGPRAAETGEAAELLAELTGHERVAFATSGTEANSAAIRLARAATGRDVVVTFTGAYHGHADNVLGRSSGGRDPGTVPVSSGIPLSAVADLLVLDYGSDAALAEIEREASRIAAVVVEPVQSRDPGLRPVDFVRRLRELTARHGIVLLFDEMLTGFRPAPRGAQELYGVVPDLATYGKLLGGGFPIGAIAGRADLMDGVDGGHWSYGDASYPPADTTFFGGTYLQHPVSMVAARAVLAHLKEHSPTLQNRLNTRTDAMAGELNSFFEAEEFPLRVAHYGSQFRFEHRADMELLYPHLLLRGVHVWEWRNFFLSTAHTDADVEWVVDAVRGSLRELRTAGFFPSARKTAGPTAQGRPPKPVPSDRPRVVAVPWNTTAVQAATRTEPAREPEPAPEPAPAPPPSRPAPDFSVYFFGDYPQDESGSVGGAGSGSRPGKYDTLLETARFADRHGFHALWMPERHFHSFGGLFPNPAVLAAALSRETERIRLNAGSVVLPLHDPIRVAEEWSMVDNLSGGRVGIGVASGWHANDFVFFPERYGRHKEVMYEQLAQVRELWGGGALRRASGDGEAEVRLFPRPVQDAPPFHTAVVGNPASFEAAGRHDLGVVTNLMTQTVEQLAENVARYRAARARQGLDPAAGRVAVLLHTYLAADHATARRDAYEPLSRYMRASLSLFGGFTNSLGHHVDLASMSADDLDTLFRRAYDRYCDQRALIGSVDGVSPVVDAVRDAGVDEVVSLVDFGVPPEALRAGLVHLDGLRRRHTEHAERAERPGGSGAAPAHARSAPHRVAAPAPLSPAQLRLWFADRLHPGGTAYNEVKAIRLEGPLDAAALRGALDALVARHACLRTVFRDGPQGPEQITLTPTAADFAVVDAAADPRGAVERVRAEESARRFDLASGPLFLARLVRLAPEEHVLVLSLHHIVADASSATVLVRDLAAFYRAGREGTTAELPDLTGSYADHARVLATRAAAPDDGARADIAHWRARLAGLLPVLALPLDRPRPDPMTSNGRAAFHHLDTELTSGARAFGRAHRATLFMTLLAGYAAMLHRVTGQEDLVVGVPTSDRPEEAEGVVGLFLNTLALRLDLSGDPSFAELVGRVRGTALDAYDHAGVPFETVVRELAPARGTDRTPVFQTLADFERADPFHFDLPGVRVTPLASGPDKALSDLAVHFTDRPEGILCHLEYNTDLFDAGTVDGFFTTFRGLLAAGVADPGAPLSRLRASVAEGDPVPDAWTRGPVVPARDAATVHELVARQVAAGPDRPAVDDGVRELTYRQLSDKADQLVRVLNQRPGPTVALWLPRSVDLVVAMLAVLRSGRAYVPLDPSLGLPRARSLIAECGARTVVAPADRVAELALPDGVVAVSPDATEPPDGDVGTAPATDAESLCYVIHTSGSTGRPKGVAVPHRAVVDRCRWAHRRFGLTAADRSAVVCGQSFDAAVLEVWPALTSGASLVIAPDAVRTDPLALARWYTERRATFSILPTALGEAVLRLPAAEQPPLRALLLGGDVMRVRPRPEAAYETVNVYGPTEVTVLCTTATVRPAGPDDGEIPLGRPVDNVRLSVLDASGAPVPVGAVGELYVAGPGVARGYLDEPEDGPGARFAPDPGGGPGARRYRTGDLVRWTSRGVLQFRGRTDDQVKVRGYRVEPQEVSRALAGLDGVRDAVVVARRDSRGEAYLAAFVVPHGTRGTAAAEHRPVADELAGRLATLLPDHLVPRAWAVLTALPLTGNGKVDGAALPETDLTAAVRGTAGEAYEEDPEPRTPDTRTPDTRTPEPQNPGPRIPGPRRPGPRADGALHRVTALWAEEFGVDPASLTPATSFFDLGGHSITAIRLVNRVREEFGVEYPMARVYRTPTLGHMADHLAENAVELEQVAPATFQQAGFLDAHLAHPLPQIFNVALRLSFEGALDVVALRAALTRLFARHEGLRSRFARRDGAWVQEVLRPVPVELAVEDLTGLDAVKRDAEVERVSAECTETPLDVLVSAAPRLRLLRRGERSWTLMFVPHHATCDGWALSRVFEELSVLYAEEVSGVPGEPLPEAFQVSAYARWQRERPDPAADEGRLAFWLRELAGASFAHALPLDRPRGERPGQDGDMVAFTVPAGVREDVERLAARRATTPFTVTVAALGRLLAREAGQPDVLLGISYANRERREFESLVACTAASYALRVREVPGEPFGELVDRVGVTAAECLDHALAPRQVAPVLRERTGAPMPDQLPLAFAYQSSTRADLDLPGVTVAVEDLTAPVARVDLVVGLIPVGDVLAGYLSFPTDLWDRPTVEGWAARYVELLAREVGTALHG